MADRIEAIALTIVVVCLLIVVADRAIDRWRKRHQPNIDLSVPDTVYDCTMLRVYVNGYQVIGPLSLSDLGLIIRYGGYNGAGEWSILHVPTPPGVIHPEFDVTVDYRMTETREGQRDAEDDR